MDRRAVTMSALVGTMLLLSGCGFRPVYGTGGSDNGVDVMGDLQATKIQLIQDREGQVLHNLLLDRFNPKGRPTQSQYTLDVALGYTTVDRGTLIDATVTRAELTMVATANLSAFGEITSFTSRAVSTYSLSTSDYAAEVAKNNAVDRTLVVIADDLRIQIATFFEKQRLLKG
jgi:LPS-assembly lipoprotein